MKWEWLLYAAVAYCILAPPKWDLAIRLKERNEEWAKKLRERGK